MDYKVFYKGWTIRYNESFPFPNKWIATCPGKESLTGGSVGNLQHKIDEAE